MDETELIAAARLGDEDAFTVLYQQHLGYVKAAGRAILRRNELEDMCQDTFMLAFTRLHSFEGNSQFRTWITRIATNRCLAILRKERRNGESHHIRLDPETSDDLLHGCLFASDDENLAGVQARLDMDKLLRGLKPMQRLVLEMAYVEDMPAQEIAEALGTTLACVKNSIHLAKRRAREIDRQE
jgi:RNA polymerase sigma-70 factor (ECF subfamily)